VKAISAAGAALALFASPLAYAADPFLPHHTPRKARFDGNSNCEVTVQHGNYLATAYAKIKANNRFCLTVDVQVTALKDGKLVDSDVRLATNPRVGEWYQVAVPFSNIVGSRFRVDTLQGAPRTRRFRGI
jgi:hypothetical protein